MARNPRLRSASTVNKAILCEIVCSLQYGVLFLVHLDPSPWNNPRIHAATIWRGASRSQRGGPILADSTPKALANASPTAAECTSTCIPSPGAFRVDDG